MFMFLFLLPCFHVVVDVYVHILDLVTLSSLPRVVRLGLKIERKLRNPPDVVVVAGSEPALGFTPSFASCEWYLAKTFHQFGNTLYVT
jgi:hypothetical protein